MHSNCGYGCGFVADYLYLFKCLPLFQPKMCDCNPNSRTRRTIIVLLYNTVTRQHIKTLIGSGFLFQPFNISYLVPHSPTHHEKTILRLLTA